MIFAEYLRELVPYGVSERLVAAAVIAAVGLVNVRSVRWGMWLENGTAGATVAALGLVAVLALGVALLFMAGEVKDSARTFPRALVGGVAVVVLLPTLGALHGVMMTGPRIFSAMAEDRLM